jgi:DNA-binding beta-propeller fold protein YncE
MGSSRIIAGLLLTLAAGCSPKALTFLNAPEPPILWPPAPDQPRIRYVGELTGSEDIGQQKSFGEVMDELLYGPKPKPRLVSPQSVAVNATGEKIAVADVNAKCVHVFDTKARKYASLVQVGVETFGQEATRQDSIGSADRIPTSSPAAQSTGGQAASGTELRRPGGRLESPVAVCWAGDSLWVADSVQHAIAIFERGGAGRWIAFDKLKRPAGVAYCPTNQLCYVSDAGAHRILALDRAGRPMVEIGSHGNGPGQFNCPSHLACGPDGSLVVADSLNFRVQRLGIDGSPRACFGR